MATTRNYQHELLRTRLEVQEQALQHISSEIQENIGQVLSGVQMKLIAMSRHIKDRAQAEGFTEAASRMGKSIKDLRQLSHLLDSATVEKIGLIDAVEKELAFIAAVYHLQCTFTYSELIPVLTKEQDLLLFRIVQEALTNIHKHAAASRVSVRINYDGGLLILRIADNGTGIDPDRYREKSSGLNLIRDRIELLKGSLAINTGPGEGTELVLTCKINHE